MQRIGSLADPSEFVTPLRYRDEFRNSTGSLIGRRRWREPGVLSEPHLSMFNNAVNARSLLYVVVSNGSPIAWLNSQSQWVIPTGDYNPTSRKHQDKIRSAVMALQQQAASRG